MSVPSPDRIAELLRPYHPPLPQAQLAQLHAYLELLLRWNARTNLTAIRDPELLVQRQIGESLLAAQFVSSAATLLDFGSGAGFPGVPLQIVLPGLCVTLAESQSKKAAFLREATRVLALPTEVWAGRVEDLPSDRNFDVVAMRAVDQSEAMVSVAQARVAPVGRLLRYLSGSGVDALAGWVLSEATAVPLGPGRIASFLRG